MKNIRIPGFPPPRNQDKIRFIFFKKLSYSSRMLIYLGLISTGFILQIIILDVIPGIFIVIFASLLMIVKGNTTEPDVVEQNHEDSWTKTNIDKIYLIMQMKKEINKWDRDALDISNGLGCFTFIIAFMVMGVFVTILHAATNNNIGDIVSTNLIVLIISIWLNGMRTKGDRENLYIKSDFTIGLHKYFENIKMPRENFVPSIVLRREKQGKEFPTDCRFNIVFDNAPADFYGVQAQININVVKRPYPFFYCVITAKEGFGLGKYVWSIDIPKSVVMQYSRDSGADVIVIRQHTTRTSGYHTDMKASRRIFDIALALARKILADTAKLTS